MIQPDTTCDPRATPSDMALRAEVIRGFTTLPKTLPPKLFYDAAGAALFERITELPEYYLSRAELEILRAHGRDIARLGGPQCASWNTEAGRV